jgi:hypothetical protein
LDQLANDKDLLKEELIGMNHVGSERVIEMDISIKRLNEVLKYEKESFETE